MNIKLNKLKLYTFFVIALGFVALFLWTWKASLNWEAVKGFIVWGTLLIIAESFSVSLPHGGYVTLGFPIVFAALLTQGSPVGVWVAVCGGLAELRKGKKADFYKILFDCAQLTLSISGAWLAYIYLGGGIINSLASTRVIPLVVAALSYFGLNSFLVSTVLALQKNTSILDMWSTNFRWATPNYLAQTPLGYLMAIIYSQISWWAVTFVMLPLFTAYWVYRLYVEMRKGHFEMIQALATAVEARDPYTEEHSQRMADYAVAVAKELGCSIYFTEIIRYATILHDIGKIGISDRILSKNGTLTEKEWEEIKKHSVIGAEIIAKIDSFGEASRLVYHHHERYNGKGYPGKLRGEEIPLGSRIIAVVDAYDAMTSGRPYRKRALTKEEAVAELKRCAGEQFDKKVVEAFLKVLSKNSKNDTT